MVDPDAVFLDSSVLVYAGRRTSARHAEASAPMARLTREGVRRWISRQILREHLVITTRPQGAAAPLPMDAAVKDVRWSAQLFQVADENAKVTAQLLDLLHAYPIGGAPVHDANIVATMLANGIGRLATFNAADFVRFAGLRHDRAAEPAASLMTAC